VIGLSIPEKLQIFLNESNGVITAAKANQLGTSNERLRLLAKNGELERSAHGVYITPDSFIDRMYIIQLRRPKIVYSHETALFLHDLTDRDPVNYTVTVPTGYNASNLRKDNIYVYTVKKEYHKIDILQIETIFGNMVKVYNLERTICDCLRSRNKIDIAIVNEMFKRYVKRSNKNLNILMQKADMFGITKLLRKYLEVLL